MSKSQHLKHQPIPNIEWLIYRQKRVSTDNG